MASFGQGLTQPRDALHRALPRLYKFAVVLSVNEQLARALLRGTCRSLSVRKEQRIQDREYLVEALYRMYSLWMGKIAEDPNLQRSNAPEPRLFAGSILKSSLAGNAHFAKFITHLPYSQRGALYLVYGEGMSYDEAAEVLSLNMLSFMNLLARGHVALAHWLDHRGLADDTSMQDETGLRLGKPSFVLQRAPEKAA
jgi:RNA polymerase sigma-70 factor, ECF subfamily